MGRTIASKYPGTLFGKCCGGDIAVSNKLNAAGTCHYRFLCGLAARGADGVNVSDMQEGGSINLSSTLRFYGDDSW